MPDWKEIVGERLGSTADPQVVSELAAHLEEVYEEMRVRGVSGDPAAEFALQEVQDWHGFAIALRRAREGNFMNYRTKSLWLPALATFFGTSVSLTVCQSFGLQPHTVWIGQVGLTLYWVWLATLPMFGAMGALLSRRACGLAAARLTAGLFPALIMLVVLCVILPWGLAIDGFAFLRLVGFGLGAVNWVVLPAIALLLGALPFLGQASPGNPTIGE
jgi:hypothetical protein